MFPSTSGPAGAVPAARAVTRARTLGFPRPTRPMATHEFHSHQAGCGGVSSGTRPRLCYLGGCLEVASDRSRAQMLWAVLAAWSLAPRDSALSHARQEQLSVRVTLQGCLQPQDGEILAENFSSQGHRDVALVQGGGEGSWGLHPSTQEGLRTWREPPPAPPERQPGGRAGREVGFSGRPRTWPAGVGGRCGPGQQLHPHQTSEIPGGRPHGRGRAGEWDLPPALFPEGTAGVGPTVGWGLAPRTRPLLSWEAQPFAQPRGTLGEGAALHEGTADLSLGPGCSLQGGDGGEADTCCLICGPVQGHCPFDSD